MLNSRSLDCLGNSTSGASQKPAGFVRPFCQGDAGKFGIFTFCLALSKDAGVFRLRVSLSLEIEFAWAANPTKTRVVKIVEFYLGFQCVGIGQSPCSMFHPETVEQMEHSKIRLLIDANSFDELWKCDCLIKINAKFRT